MQRQPHIRGREHSLTPEKKVELCALVAKSATVVEAAEAVGVSIRTVQRERKIDEDFDHEIRLALQSPPDPLKLMQAAARTHWRAAAWLLERTQPEKYARKPHNMASAKRVHAALHAVLEAALEATEPQLRGEVYKQVHQALQQAFDCCFPNLGPWGRPRAPQPKEAPLAEHERYLATMANAVPDFDEEGHLVYHTPPASRSHAPRGNAMPDAPRHETNIPPTPPTSEPAHNAPNPNAPPVGLKAQPTFDDLQYYSRVLLDAITQQEGLVSPKIDVATQRQHRDAA